MPYIKLMDRPQFQDGLSLLNPKTAGELNYCITMLVQKWVKEKGISYETLNAAHGVLACAQSELYRRLTSEYEDGKVLQNGDVFSESLLSIRKSKIEKTETA